ncbi:MAG: hypothetical protein OEV06_04730, partial [Anaerolineae bacterium]|nr:hypothetical protein [Anaerolineae bacterium]
MEKRVFPAMLLVLAMVSCVSGGQPQGGMDPQERRATAQHLAGTYVALTEEAQPPTALPSPTRLPTETPLPTATPTPTDIPTRLTTIQRANCRNGPGVEYRILFTYEEQLTFTITGRNEESTWWYVEPENLDEGCWFSGEVSA